MKNATILSSINIKGGVGKTTTTCCLAEILAELNLKVLLIDDDPQANTSQLFNRYQTHDKTINNIYLYKGQEINYENISACIQKTDIENIDIIASTEELTFTCNNVAYDTSRAQQYILKKAIGYIKDDYDMILIDNTPFFNILSINTLCASDYVITPVQSNGFSYAGLTMLLEQILNTKDEFNPDLQFLGVFFTNVNPRKVVFKDLYEAYQNEIGDKFISQYIRQDKNVDESSTAFVPLLKYNKNSNAVKDYRKLLYSLNILDKDKQQYLDEIIKKDKDK